MEVHIAFCCLLDNMKFIKSILYHGGLLGLGLYIGLMGAEYHTEIKRVEYNLLYGDRKPAVGFFQDPLGLEIEYKINEQGMVESYLKHVPSHKKITIGEDMLPDSKTMLEALLSQEVENGR